MQARVGIPYVIVDGTIALKNGQVLDVDPGPPMDDTGAAGVMEEQ